MRNEFAGNLTGYTTCILKNSEPVNYCINCVIQYKDTVTSFQTFINGKEKSNGKQCRSEFIDLDEINMIQRIYDEAIEKWTSGSCSGPLSADMACCCCRFETNNCLFLYYVFLQNVSNAMCWQRIMCTGLTEQYFRI